MERQPQSVKGWRGFIFDFSSTKQQEEEDPIKHPYESEELDYGCTRFIIDFDKLDQQ